MFTRTEEIMGIKIDYDDYFKRDLDEFHLFMPLTYDIARSLFNFLNDNFHFEKDKPELSVLLYYNMASYRREIELSVRIKETGWGEAELFTIDVFSGRYDSPGNAMRNFTSQFIDRFQKNLIRNAVMEKIELYRHPPKPPIDWHLIRLTNMTGLMLARCAMALGIGFVLFASFIIYICL